MSLEHVEHDDFVRTYTRCVLKKCALNRGTTVEMFTYKKGKFSMAVDDVLEQNLERSDGAQVRGFESAQRTKRSDQGSYPNPISDVA